MASSSLNTQTQLEQRATDLMEIHARLQKGKGRRRRTEAINASAIVLLVAAWEGYVEALADEAVQALRTALPTHPALPIMEQALARYKSFNTPNAEKVRELFKSVIGLDLRPLWTWNTPRFSFDEQSSCKRLNEILQIRHSIAHGFGCPQQSWLRHQQTGLYSLRKEHVDRVINFFKKLSEITDSAVANHMVTFGIAKPW